MNVVTYEDLERFKDDLHRALVTVVNAAVADGLKRAAEMDSEANEKAFARRQEQIDHAEKESNRRHREIVEVASRSAAAYEAIGEALGSIARSFATRGQL